jgi:hypothetical protein
MRSTGATTVAAALIAVALLWIGGKRHRANCISAGRVECSVLPWNYGKPCFKARGQELIACADVQKR